MITKSYDTLPQCAKDIRINVFIKEQGFQEEFDKLDGISDHLVTFDGDKPCATVRFYEQDGIYYIGRLAVLKEYRSKHLGAKIVNEAEKIIKEKGGAFFGNGSDNFRLYVLRRLRHTDKQPLGSDL